MIRRLVLPLAAMLLATGPALAQSAGLPTAGTSVGAPDGAAQARSARRRPEQAPVGVPGARADQDLAAPAERPAGDMPPTEALFDAVNRGDLAAAKDAIGRGADIQGHNVLGLSPLELAVDLGRNDISFLLLSLRGGAGYSAARPQRGAEAADTKPTATDRRAERLAEQAARRQQQAEARAAQRTAASARPAPPRSARLFAADGGAPVPQAGFLGFDTAR